MMRLFTSAAVVNYCLIGMSTLARRKKSSASSSSAATKTAAVANCSIGWAKLAKAWAKDFIANTDGGVPVSGSQNRSQSQEVAAAERTLPLLAGGGGSASNPSVAIPFVCRYRSDLISPLTNKQVHLLSDLLEKHQKLESLRRRIIEALGENIPTDLRFRVETSTSKSELEDIYAPYKPPSKGSLEERILKENPSLVSAVSRFWEGDSDVSSNSFGQQLKPREQAVTLLANRIATHQLTMEACLGFAQRSCRIKVGLSSSSKKGSSSNNSDNNNDLTKFETYDGFEAPLYRLKNHQVLAIRRGIDVKALTAKYEMDGERAVGVILASMRRDRPSTSFSGRALATLWKDAAQDAWSRLLRKRCERRCWNELQSRAEERGVQVFCDNLRRALLVPPPRPARYVIAVDPGFKAGIKVALLCPNGNLIEDEKSSLSTIQFIGNHRERARDDFIRLLRIVHEKQLKHMPESESAVRKVTVALGNGHGTQEARQLLSEASKECAISVDIQSVSEAGASVWSVTEAAQKEFPSQHASSIAAVSIGRRYQNALPELVKIPPRSLGLGMYQHDFKPQLLERKLHLTSVDAVAEVGVEANSCSLEILSKVPGITQTLASRIIDTRPLRSRNELMALPGLGPKTYELCAAFIRVHGEEMLDRTLVHPESYRLARFLLKELDWNLNDPSSIDGSLPIRAREKVELWKDLLSDSASRFDAPEGRVLSVIEHLHASITNPDPRLKQNHSDSSTKEAAAGRTDSCSALPSNLLASSDGFKGAQFPIRNILARVRNVVDFGVFVDFGGENDALVHRSRLGRGNTGAVPAVPLESLLVGQEIGIDILGISSDGSRVSASLSGLMFPADSPDILPGKRKKRLAEFASQNERTRESKQTKRRRAASTMSINGAAESRSQNRGSS